MADSAALLSSLCSVALSQTSAVCSTTEEDVSRSYVQVINESLTVQSWILVSTEHAQMVSSDPPDLQSVADRLS